MTKSGKKYIPKWQLVIGFIAAGLLVVLSVFSALQLTNRHRDSIVEVPQDRVLEVSEVVKKYGAPQLSEDAKKSGKNLTILFFYDGYDNDDKALRQIGLLQGALKNTQPFASSEVVDTRVITSAVDRCKVEKKAQNILVCDKSLISQINKLGIKNFKLVVLSPLNFVPNARVARGKNVAMYLPAYKGVLTDEELNVFLTRFFLHELGHTFGLRDEYAFERSSKANYEAVSDNAAYQTASPNCAPDQATAEKWWANYAATSEKIDYNQGCAGNKAFVFPQKETVMSDNPQDADFGLVSEDYLRGALDCFYGDKASIVYPQTGLTIDGRLQACDTFRAQYPNFWSE